MRGATKDLTSRIYWSDFGRRALGDAFMPTPAEAAQVVSDLMDEVDRLKVELGSIRNKRLAQCEKLRTIAMRAAGDLDAVREEISRD
jgi:hypothetical protein